MHSHNHKTLWNTNDTISERKWRACWPLCSLNILLCSQSLESAEKCLETINEYPSHIPCPISSSCSPISNDYYRELIYFQTQVGGTYQYSSGTGNKNKDYSCNNQSNILDKHSVRRNDNDQHRYSYIAYIHNLQMNLYIDHCLFSVHTLILCRMIRNSKLIVLFIYIFYGQWI